jgi:hypothetical protein
LTGRQWNAVNAAVVDADGQRGRGRRRAAAQSLFERRD